jgi:O-antigen/teichoic acid export membrane protein
LRYLGALSVGEIRKQGIFNTVISYSGIGIGFVYTLVLLPKFLSPDEVGLTRVLFSLSTIFGTLFPFGLGSFTIKYFPRFRNHSNGHHGYLRLLLLLTLLSYLLFAVLMFLFKDKVLVRYDNSPLLVQYFTFVFPISLAIGFISMLNVYCISLFHSSVPSFLNEVYFRVANILVITLYYFKVISFDVFVICYSICFLSQLLFLFVYVFRIDRGIRHSIDWNFVRSQDLREMSRYILLIAPASIASMALRQIDVTMLGSDLNGNAPLADVAVYTIGFTIGSIIEAPFNALARITDSKVSDAFHRNDMRLVDEVYNRSTRILMIIGGLLFVGVVADIHTMLRFLPHKYLQSEYVVIIVGASCFFNMATGINSSIIFYSDKYRQGSFLLFALIITSVILNYILIPLYGIEGAAIATGSALFFFNLAKWLLIKKYFGLQPYGKYVFVVALLMAASLVVNHFLPYIGNKYFDLAYRSAIMTIIYGGGILVTGIFPEANGFIKKHAGINL